MKDFLEKELKRALNACDQKNLRDARRHLISAYDFVTHGYQIRFKDGTFYCAAGKKKKAQYKTVGGLKSGLGAVSWRGDGIVNQVIDAMIITPEREEISIQAFCEKEEWLPHWYCWTSPHMRNSKRMTKPRWWKKLEKKLDGPYVPFRMEEALLFNANPYQIDELFDPGIPVVNTVETETNDESD